MKKIQKTAVLAFLFLLPVIYPLSSSMDARQFQEWVFLLGAMSLASLFIEHAILTCFFLLNVVLFVANGGVVGQLYVFNIFCGLMIFAVSRKFFKASAFADASKILLALAALDLCFVTLQLLGIDPIHVQTDNLGVMHYAADLRDPAGLFFIKSFNAVFLAVILPAAASFSLPASLFLFAPLWLCHSTGAILAGVSGLLFYVWHSARKWFLWLLIPFAGLTLLYAYFKDYRVDPESFTSRFNVWHAGLKFSFYRPWGYGPDSWANLTPHKNFLFSADEETRTLISVLDETTADKPEKKFHYYYYDANRHKMETDYKGMQPKTIQLWDNPHNEYIGLLFEYGFLGLLLLGLLIRDIWLRFRSAAKTKDVILIASMLLVYALSGITQFPVHVARLAYLLPVLLGAFYAKTDDSSAA